MSTSSRSDSNARAAALWRAALVFLGLLATPAAAQPSVDLLAEQREHAEADHLWRVGIWGAANLAAGTALLLATDAEGRKAFAMQSAAWGAVNVGIAAVALTTGGEAGALSLGDALAAENRLGDILWLNMGLNVGYVAVGTTLYAVGSRAGVAEPETWRGHGAAVIVQGLGLLALDGVALAASLDRSGHLVKVLSELSVTAAPGGLGLVVGL